MTIVNFSIKEPLAKKINRVIKEWGFASKAEFFRFIAINFVEREEKREAKEQAELAYYSDRLEETIKKKFKNKKIPSLEEQLKDLL